MLIALLVGHAVVLPTGAAAETSAGTFVALGVPARVLDSRSGRPTADGEFAGGGVRPAGSVLRLDVAGRVGVPDGVSAVVANLTVTEPVSAGYATVYACDEPRPTASNVNYTAGQTVANLSVARVAVSGEVCVFTLGEAHLVVDVAGYFPEGSFVALGVPARVLDSRSGRPTADGEFAGGGVRPAGSVLRLDVAGRVGVPDGVSAVVANLTVTEPVSAGYATVFPLGVDRPVVSNLNYTAGRTVANSVITALGPGGELCLFTHADAHYVVDVIGYFPGPIPGPVGQSDCPADSDTPPSVPLPPDALPVDTSDPDHVIGTGTPTSCTSAAVVAAVAAGGIITFDCGAEPVVIDMADTARVVNTSPVVVLDGGGKVTLSGQSQRRILYQNTCDPAQTWTTSHCDDQPEPNLVVQNIAFADGNSTGDTTDGGGGGAVFVRGGRLKVVNATFTGNRCDAVGPDVGGAAIRVLDQHMDLPVIVAGATFGGAAEQGNQCSNGGAISSIGVSWQIYNTVFTHNRAIGTGANPAEPGTPGGGNGGAICLDGNTFTLELRGSVMHDNVANEGGGAIFFVSNDRSGHLTIDSSTLHDNPSLGFETAGYPGIFYLGDGPPTVTSSSIT